MAKNLQNLPYLHDPKFFWGEELPKFRDIENVSLPSASSAKKILGAGKNRNCQFQTTKSNSGASLDGTFRVSFLSTIPMMTVDFCNFSIIFCVSNLQHIPFESLPTAPILVLCLFGRFAWFSSSFS